MDIERLKELTQSEDSDLWDYKEELIALIDAEIACQSATSEEVQRAIEQLKYAREQDREFDDGTFVDSLDLAINALQAYQPTTRKDRIVEEVAISKTETTSCEWCEKVGKYAQFDFATYTEVDGDKEYEYAVKVNYCSNCGRKLKGE